MKVIGIGGYLGHDSSAALLADGRCVAAAQEERFTRSKHAKGVPHHAIDYCLAQAGLSGDEIDEVQLVGRNDPFSDAQMRLIASRILLRE